MHACQYVNESLLFVYPLLFKEIRSCQVAWSFPIRVQSAITSMSDIRRGLIIVNTGPGKGKKTTAAMGRRCGPSARECAFDAQFLKAHGYGESTP